MQRAIIGALCLFCLIFITACYPESSDTPPQVIAAPADQESEKPAVQETSPVPEQPPASAPSVPVISPPESPPASTPVQQPSELIVETMLVLESTFEPDFITIPAGTTVRWINERTGARSDASSFVIGAKGCKFQTKTFKPGESVEYTFENPGTCVVVDGVRLTQQATIQII